MQQEEPSVLNLPDTLQSRMLFDGRKVSVSTCGDPYGHPVLFLHPIQGNRYMPLTMHKAAAALGLRITALDRPGIGASSPQPNRTVQQYPADVAELCEQLSIKQFSIFASSAGTMYALALTLAPETKHMVVGKVTLVAPWIPTSSRAPGFGGWLSLLGSWTPVPLLHIAVGFSNSRIAQQALRRRQFRHAAKHSSKALAWGHWLVATAADVAVAGASSLTHTTHFVINEYLQSSSSHRKDLHSNKHSSTSSSNGSKSSTHKSSSHSVLTVNGTRKCSVVLAAAPAAAHDSSSDTSSCCSSQSSMDDCPDTIKGAATQPAKCVACHAPSRPSSCTACNSSSTYNTICIGSSTSDMLSISTAYDESCCPTAYITTYSLPMSRSSSSSSDLSSRSSDISTAAALGKHTAASGKNSYFNNNSDHSSSGKHSREKPVTELMTRSNDVERAAFAAEPGNDAIYKAMINEWNPSLAGIIQEMQLCTERSAKLHFNYAQDVTAPVRVYMGTADQVLLHSHVQHWAEHADNVELISVDGGTHDGLMHTHKVAALEALARDLQDLTN